MTFLWKKRLRDLLQLPAADGWLPEARSFPALIASGLLATVLTIMTLVLHVDASTSSTYSILYNLSQTVFLLHAGPSGHLCQKFGTEAGSPWILAPLPTPGLGGWCGFGSSPTTRSAVLRATYNGAVIRIILSVFVMSLLDKMAQEGHPGSCTHFVKPFTLLLLVSVITRPSLAPGRPAVDQLHLRLC